MKYLFLLFTLLCLSCAHVNTHPYPGPWTKARVIHWLEDARDSHIRNRGHGDNSLYFDDYCVRNYDAILKWIEENTE